MNRISGSDWALLLFVLLCGSCEITEYWIASRASVECLDHGGQWHQADGCKSPYCGPTNSNPEPRK